MKSEKVCGTVTYRMHVIARDAAELAGNAGGLIVDRMMGGWRVSVQLLEPGDIRPVQILGAELIDTVEAQSGYEDEHCVLVMGVGSYAHVMSGDSHQRPGGCVQVLVWGETSDPTQAFGHNLSAAARAFKALAVAAADLPADEVATAETFTSMNAKTGGVTVRA